MTIYRDLFIFSGIAALLACNGVNAQNLKYSLSQPSIEPGQRVMLELRLPIANSQHHEAQLNDVFLSQSKKVQILESNFEPTPQALIWRYALTSYEVGTVSIPPIEIQWGPHSFSSESIPLEVKTTRAPHDQEIRKAFGPISPPLPWKKALPYLFLLTIGAALYFLFRKYGSKLKIPVPRPAPVSLIPKESNLDWLKRHLSRIHNQLENPQLNLVDELTDVLREYYARESKCPVRAWTSHEFQQNFLKDNKAQQLFPIFQKCDEVKFTGKRLTSLKTWLEQRLAESEGILIPCGT